MNTSAQQVVDVVLDDRSVRWWANPTDDAVLVGEGEIDGRRVAVVLGEFTHLGGSVGVETADRIVACIHRATAERLPLFISPASGGTRMQEGTLAFVRMRDIVAAMREHGLNRLASLVWLRNPTFGGVFASWGSRGQITTAEPHAALGMLGPRVFEALTGHEFAAGVQEAGNLCQHGILDAVVPIEGLRRYVVHALDLMCPPAQPLRTTEAPTLESGQVQPPKPHGAQDVDGEPAQRGIADTWSDVLSTRRAQRPGIRVVLAEAGVDLFELSGTGYGETGRAVLLAVARFGARSCVLVAQDRQAQATTDPLGPAALRVARRGIRLAGELHLPLVTVVDTPGAELSVAAEQGGLSAEVAACLDDLAGLQTPSVCLLLGQGSGAAALAFAATDRVVAAQHAWLSALPPEGASAILFHTPVRADEAAIQQGISSAALHAAGVVHRIVAEHPDAAEEVTAFSIRVVSTLADELAGLAEPPRTHTSPDGEATERRFQHEPTTRHR